MVITICGSTKFKDEILSVAEQLTLQDHIVLMPNVFHHSDDVELSTEQKARLDNLHRQKIEMSDGIFVVNVDGYIGASTYGELDWAQRKQKSIWFLVDPNAEPEPPVDESDDGNIISIETIEIEDEE